MTLIEEYMRTCYENPRISREINQKIIGLLKIPDEQPVEQRHLAKKRRCKNVLEILTKYISKYV